MLNTNKGQRFVTYAVAGDSGSGEVVLDGQATACGQVGDKFIVLSCGRFSDEQARALHPRTAWAD